jgi:hypothetical protein
VIFYHSPEQKEAALKSYQELTRARAYRAPIVTQLVPMQTFYPAEEYHQNYYGGRDGRPAPRRKAKRGRQPAATSAVSKQKNASSGENDRRKAPEKDPQKTAPAKRATGSSVGPKSGNDLSDLVNDE